MSKKRGFTLTEAIFCVAMIVILIFTFVSCDQITGMQAVKEKARQSKCKANLSMIGQSMTMYQLDFGRQVFYPRKNGQGFITTLYAGNILTESEVYLCPSTNDTNNNGADLASALELGDAQGPVSYAGRKNRDQENYPGIFKLLQETSTTPICSDDMGKPENHENGDIMMLLFLDGHVDHVKKATSNFKQLFDVLAN